MIEDDLRPSFIRYGTSLGAKAGVVLAAAYPITVVSICALLSWASPTPDVLEAVTWDSAPSIYHYPFFVLLDLLKAWFTFLRNFFWYLIFIGIASSIVGAVGGWTLSRILLHSQRYLSRKYAVAVGITVGFLVAVIYLLAWWRLLFPVEPSWLLLVRGETFDGRPVWDYSVFDSGRLWFSFLLIDIPSLFAILAGGWGGGKLYDEFVGARAESNVQ